MITWQACENHHALALVMWDVNKIPPYPKKYITLYQQELNLQFDLGISIV